MPPEGIEHLIIEAASLNAVAKDAIEKAYDLGRHLEDLGAFVRHALVEMHAFETRDDLSEKSTRLRAIVFQGMTVLSELERHAGRLEALAEVRSAVETPDETLHPNADT